MIKIAENFNLVSIDTLVPYARNARTHSETQIAQLRGSLREFGFVSPILIDGACNVIAGHGRLEAARAEGMAEVPCVQVEHLTDAQRRAYIIADNRLAEAAGWDEELLQLELGELKDLDFDIQLTGFDESYLDLNIGDLGLDAEAEEDDFDPEPPADPITKPGDIWILGRHRLVCGDCCDPETLSRIMDKKKADLLITDPPYNVDYVGKTANAMTIANDHLSGEDYRKFLEAAFRASDAVMRPGAAFYIFCADSGRCDVQLAAEAAGWQIRQALVWNKNSFVLGRQDYQWKHEPCLYGWKEGAAHEWFGGYDQSTVIDCERPTRNDKHPTMKPVKLFDRLIRNNTSRSGVVLDGFAGSGTSIIACEQNGRTCYAVELAPEYCDVIVARWEQLTGGKAEKR